MELISNTQPSSDNQQLVITDIIGKNIKIKLLNVGAAIQSLQVKDKTEQWQDIVLGYQDLDNYLSNNDHALGVVHALVTNRINKATFHLNGTEYNLPKNDQNINALHCGNLRYLLWQAKEISDNNYCGIEYQTSTPDNYEGLPGPATICIRYYIDKDDKFYIEYSTTAQHKTIIANLTNHSYFNLDGDTKNGLDNHYLQIQASNYAEVNKQLIPTGNINRVDDVYNFLQLKPLTQYLKDIDHTLKDAAGYDTHYIFDSKSEQFTEDQRDIPPFVAKLTSKKTGIVMDLATNYPGLQLYTGNWLDGLNGKNGVKYQAYSGVCLETQCHPDAPNHQSFPDISIQPYQTNRYISVYKFSSTSSFEHS